MKKKYVEQVCACGGRIAIVREDGTEYISYACIICGNHWSDGRVNIAPYFETNTVRPEGMVDTGDWQKELAKQLSVSTAKVS